MPKQQHTSHLLNNAQKRVHVVFALSATALFLSACHPSANTSPFPSATAISHSNAAPADSQPIDEDASTATSSSGHTDDSPLADYIPELGTPDPTDPNFELFEPCSEIPAEAFAASGLNYVNTTTIEGLGTSCVFNHENGLRGSISLSSIRYGKKEIQKDAFVHGTSFLGDEAEMVRFTPTEQESTYCSTALQTKRGTITLMYSEHQAAVPIDSKCETSESILSHLITNGGYNYGDEN